MAVYELGYRRLEGPRRQPELPALAIAQSELRVLRARKTIVGALLLLAGYSLLTTGYVVIRAGVLADYLPGGLSLASLPPVDRAYFEKVFSVGFYYFLVVFLTLFAGAGRIAEDLRTNALALYLSKPLSRGDYLLGKTASVAAVVALGTLGAPLLCYLVAALVDPAFLGSNLRTGAALLASGLVATAYHTSAILFFSSLVRSGRIAGLLYAALFFVSGIVSQASRLALRTERTAFLGYRANLETLAQHLYGAGENAPPLLPSLVVTTLVIAGGLLFARQRVRAVEVVR